MDVEMSVVSAAIVSVAVVLLSVASEAAGILRLKP
jgi:hypothetical protein